MFIGIDHGTRAIRISSSDEISFSIDRNEAAKISFENLSSYIKKYLNLDIHQIKLAALTYSMGDGITTIKTIKSVKNRGLLDYGGAGKFIGGGTNIFDLFYNSDIPTIVLPGIHRASNIDTRLKIFSHHASPEKIGACYYIFKKFNVESFILCDIGANTVSVGVKDGRIIGGLDACVFSPGLYQGPIDLEMIRQIDNHMISAGDGFNTGGFMKKSFIHLLEKEQPEHKDEWIMKSLSLLISMEIAAMTVLLPDTDIFLCGGLSSNDTIVKEIKKLTKTNNIINTGEIASIGCSFIAEDVYSGEREILGITVDI